MSTLDDGARVILKVVSEYINTLTFGGGQTANDEVVINHQTSYTNGSGDNEYEFRFQDGRTVANGASDDVDLGGGTLPDFFGGVLVLFEARIFYVRNDSATEWLEVGGAASDAWASSRSPLLNSTDIIQLGPGGEVLWDAPLNITFDINLGSADVLRLKHGGPGTDTINYGMLIAGDSV